MVMPQGLEQEAAWTRRDGRGSFRMLWDLLSCLSGPGDPLCCPLCPWAVLASLLSHELGSGGPGEKPGPLAKTPRRETRKEAIGTDPRVGSLMASMGREDAYLFLLILDSSARLIQMPGSISVLGHK